MENGTLKISISIVIYNPNMSILTRSLLSLITASKKLFSGNNYQTILYIVDNSVNEFETEKEIQKILHDNSQVSPYLTYKFIKTNKNLGYGKGNNVAIHDTTAKYHLIMNPDVFMQENTLLQAVNFLDEYSDVGLLSPAVYGENGERHYLFRRYPTVFDLFLRSSLPGTLQKYFKKRISWYEMRDYDHDKMITNLDCATGCFMFARTKILKKINGFDEQFFLYYEDMDLARRMLQQANNVYVPEIKVIHRWARDNHKKLKAKFYIVHSAIKFWNKWGWKFF